MPLKETITALKHLGERINEFLIKMNQLSEGKVQKQDEGQSYFLNKIKEAEI